MSDGNKRTRASDDGIRSGPSRPITLALGGGGARGLAHIGVLQVLQREGFTFAGIAGTSQGGMLGALCAAGVALSDIEAEVLRLARPREMLRLVDLGYSDGRLQVKGARICELLTGMLGGGVSFEDLPIPLALVAVDIDRGLEVIMRSGPVATAVRATISIPGVFEPVERNGAWLVDGGVLNNLPVDAARSLANAPVVAVDVIPRFRANTPGEEPVAPALQMPQRIPTFIRDTAHVNLVMVSEMTAMRLEISPPDLLLSPELPHDVGVLVGYHRAEEIIERGRAAAEASLPELRELVDGARSS